MAEKEEIHSSGEKVHFTAGALIERDGKYLLVDRANPPYGFAGIAEHVEVNESFEDGLKRGVMEETGLKVLEYELLFEEVLDWNWCSRGVNVHHWRLYKCKTSGEQVISDEAKSIGWYGVSELKELELEEVWEYWFKKVGIL